MKSDLETFYSELQERREILEEEIRTYENSKEIIYRSELEARLREIISITVRIQEMLLSNLHKTLS